MAEVCPQHDTAGDERAVVAHFILNGMGMERIRLGRFRERDPEPRFVVRLEPDEPETVVHDLSKFGDGDVYALYMQVQNFGNAPCEVWVERVGSGSYC